MYFGAIVSGVGLCASCW